MCVVSYKTFDVDCGIASFPASFHSQGGARRSQVLQYVTKAREEPEEPGAWVLQCVTQAREEPGYCSV